MEERPHIVARAFEIAPECCRLEEVRNRLKREGYLQVDLHLSGKAIRKELNSRLDREKARAYQDKYRSPGPRKND